MLESNLCLICEKGKVLEYGSWYRCNICEADSDKLIDGFLYPYERRETLCSFYIPVIDLLVSKYEINETVKFLNIKKEEKSAVIIHIDKKGNKMIIKEHGTEKIHFLIHIKEIEDAYEDLFEVSKVEFNGWWNKKIQFI